MSRESLYPTGASEPELINAGKFFGIVLDIHGTPIKVKKEKLWRRSVPYVWCGVPYKYCVYEYAFPEKPDMWYRKYQKPGE